MSATDLERVAISSALIHNPDHRRALFVGLPRETFRLHICKQLAKAFILVDSNDTAELAAKAGIDPVELLNLRSDMPDGPLLSHVKRLLAARLSEASFAGLDVAPWAESIVAATEAIRKPEESENRINSIAVLDFMSLEFPSRENILAPWLPMQGLCMLYAPRGIGKTHFSLGVAYAVASGDTFFNWMAPTPRGVLFLDGEMPAAVLQERIARIAASNDKEPTEPLRIITPDLQPHGMLDLTRPDHQQDLERHLEGIALIIVDNLSTLCRNGRENEGDSWLPVQAWALQQRAAGRSVLFIHHAGKGGQQRGTSRREDVLDTVIALRHPGDYTPDQGATFEVHFEKSRGIHGDDVKPFEAQLTTSADNLQVWVTKPLEDSTVEKVAALLQEGLSQIEIAEHLGINKSNVSRAKKKAEVMGLSTKTVTVP